MAEVPTIPTFIDGTLSSSQLNQLGDALRFALSKPRCKAVQTSIQSIPTGVLTAITFDSVEFDDYVMWDAGLPSRITAKYAGYYHLAGGIAWASNATSYRFVRLLVNGATAFDGNTVLPPASGVATRTPSRATEVYLNVDDYVEIQGQHATGAGLNTSILAGDASSLIVSYAGQ